MYAGMYVLMTGCNKLLRFDQGFDLGNAFSLPLFHPFDQLINQVSTLLA